MLKTWPFWRLEDSSARLKARRPHINPVLENPLKLRLKSIFIEKKCDIKLCSFFVQMQFLTKGIFIKRGFSYHFIYICIFVPCDLFLIAFIAGRFVFHFPHEIFTNTFLLFENIEQKKENCLFLNCNERYFSMCLSTSFNESVKKH